MFVWLTCWLYTESDQIMEIDLATSLELIFNSYFIVILIILYGTQARMSEQAQTAKVGNYLNEW